MFEIIVIYLLKINNFKCDSPIGSALFAHPLDPHPLKEHPLKTHPSKRAPSNSAPLNFLHHSGF